MTLPRSAALLLTLCLTGGIASAALEPSPNNGDITLPDGFAAVVVADDIDSPRFLAVAPNGDVYAKLSGGGITAMRDTNGDGRADEIQTFGSGSGSGIAIRDGYLYYSTNSEVYRYKRAPGQLVPDGEPELMVTGLVDRRQHNTKAFAFDESGGMLVEVGSPSNALGNPDRARGAVGASQDQIDEFLSRHGGFWRFDADQPGQSFEDGTHFSTGHRHILSIAWNPVSKSFFAAQNGRDVLNVVDPSDFSATYNAERVAEEFHRLHEGANLGWPRTYYDPVEGVRLLSPEYSGDGTKQPEAGNYADPLIAFPAHWAPMQLAYYDHEQFPEHYRGGMFLAFRGSWNRAPEPQKGYNVCFIPFNADGTPTGEYEVFADGFKGRDVLLEPRNAEYRPVGVAVGPDGSLYVGAQQGGRIWRIFHQGN